MLQQGLEAYLNRSERAGVQIPGDVLVQASKQAIPDLMWTTDPATAQAIVDSAQQAFGGKYFDVARWRDWLKTANAKRSAFYSQAGAKQSSAAIAGLPPAIEAAQDSAMRDALYQYLSPEDAGAGPREIQARTGDIINLRNHADRASNRVTGEHALTPLEGAGRSLTGATRIVGAPFQHGDLPSAFRQMAHPMIGPTDALIGRFYDSLPHADPIPQPQSAVHPWMNAPARQLPAAPGALPPPGTPPPRYSGTTGQMPPAWQANQWQNIGGQRALPPGSAGPQDFSQPAIVTPPPADASSVRSAPGMTAPPNPSRELPPARTFIVPTAESSGIHPTTGTPPTGPTYGVTPQSLAVKRGKWIWSALGGPGGGQ
jgi:hypothetical protein